MSVLRFGNLRTGIVVLNLYCRYFYALGVGVLGKGWVIIISEDLLEMSILDGTYLATTSNP